MERLTYKKSRSRWDEGRCPSGAGGDHHGAMLNELNFGRGDFGLMETEAVQVAAVVLSILEQSAVAYGVTMQSAVALGRLTREGAETALKQMGGRKQ